mmetsp:Transcript_37047/g.60125  ORF Transcript_37047/g.60125 Transcript_37047/m.60125 type:complete len:184 (-) Transcript_37047:3193-3744(-)
MLMRMNFDEDFVPCKGKMAFMDSPTSLRATYLWIALAALSPHLMEIQNASLEEKHSRRSSSSKPQGAAKVGPTRGDTGQPPNMPLIDELGNAAWKCLRNTQTPALRHFVEAFLVNVFSIQPELIDTLLLPGLESTSIRPTVKASIVIISGFVAYRFTAKRREAASVSSASSSSSSSTTSSATC